MKKVYFLLCVVMTTLTISLFAQPGTLDTEFGAGGTVITDLGSIYDEATSMAIQPDGEIVAAGMYGNSYLVYDFALVRYNLNGSLDNSFGTGGIVTTDYNSSMDQTKSVIVQPDGKIVVAGYSIIAGDADFVVMRYNSNGTLDNTFNALGFVSANISFDDEAFAVARQNDGKIVIVGTTYVGICDEFVVIRLSSDGMIDGSFGPGGYVTTNMGGEVSVAASMAIQPDGKIIAAGYTMTSWICDFAMARYNPDGTLDNSFSSDGMLTTDLGSVNDHITSIILQPDGKIVAAGGCDDGSSHPDFALVRYLPDGTLDNSFGSSGLVITPVTPDNDWANSAMLQHDGKIVVAGETNNGTNSSSVLVRYLSNGSLDNSFGIGGIVITDMGTKQSRARGVALEPDGKIVTAGASFDMTDGDFALARYIADINHVGVLDFSEMKNSILIYPNPVQGEATLGYTLTQNEEVSICLTDMQGRILQSYLDREKQEAGTHEQTIILPERLPSGNYLLTISSLKGQMCIKIIK